MKKGQSSLEQLVVVGTGIAFIAIAFYLAATYSADSTRISQAQDAVGRLAAAADYVYALGPNSKEYVDVFLPSEIDSWNITGKVIVTKILTSSGGTDVSAYSKADLVGTLPGYRGRQKILVEYLPSGKVRIGAAGLVCTPTAISRSFNAGDSGSDTITVSNTAAYNVTGIAGSVSGGGGMVSVSLQPPESLASGGSGGLSMAYSVPPEQASGAYGATVTVDSDNGGACTTQITLNVNGVTTCATLCAAQTYQSGSCRSSSSQCSANGEDYRPENDASCSGTPSTPKCCCFPSDDAQGPLVTYINSTPNATTTTDVRINATCNDTGRGDNYIGSAEVQVDFGSWNAASPSSGSFSSAVVQDVYRQVGFLVGGQHIAAVKCTDTVNNTGPIAYYYFNVSAPDSLGPIITVMNHTNPDSLAFADIIESGMATDAYTGGSNLQGCKIRVDTGAWNDAVATDGAFDSPAEGFSYNLGKLPAGTHTVYAYCTDALGNIGGVFTDTFGLAPADIVLAIERTTSMSGLIIDVSKSSTGSSGYTTFSFVKSLDVNQEANPVNVTVEARTNTVGCIAYFEARVGSTVVASGSTSSTTYTNLVSSTSLAAFSTPFSVDLYMRVNQNGCVAYNRNFRVSEEPTRIVAAQDAAKALIDLVSNTTQIGLVTFATSASTDKQMALMNSAANINALKSSIDAISPSVGNICIACGIDSGVAELASVRGRYPNATRTIILITDGPGNVGDEISSSTSARNQYVRVYTVGLGNSADPVELGNIALLTNAEYYYAPDYNTLKYIYQHIGE